MVLPWNATQVCFGPRAAVVRNVAACTSRSSADERLVNPSIMAGDRFLMFVIFTVGGVAVVGAGCDAVCCSYCPPRGFSSIY